jgi:protein TonB
MAKVLGLDAESSAPVRWVGYGLAAVALMLAFTVVTRMIALFVESTNPRPAHTTPQEIDVQVEAPPPPPAPAPTPEAKPEPAPPPRAIPHEAPPPPPAQAGKVLTRDPDPNEPVDLTGDSIVTGNAEAYVGGVTAANGTGKVPVRSMTTASAEPSPGGGPPKGPNLSRPARLAGGSEWKCPFPDEAETEQVDEAYVLVQVDIKPDGAPANVQILRDPGHGFARMARSCALNQAFDAALDHDGHPVLTTRKFNVHFFR